MTDPLKTIHGDDWRAMFERRRAEVSAAGVDEGNQILLQIRAAQKNNFPPSCTGIAPSVVVGRAQGGGDQSQAGKIAEFRELRGRLD